MLQQIIKINGVEVEKNSCSVGFNFSTDLFFQTFELTHAKLYQLLETATEIKEINDNHTTKFVQFKQGIVTFTVYQKKQE